MCYYEIEVHHVAMATGQTVNSKEIRIDLSAMHCYVCHIQAIL